MNLYYFRIRNFNIVDFGIFRHLREGSYVQIYTLNKGM